MATTYLLDDERPRIRADYDEDEGELMEGEDEDGEEEKDDTTDDDEEDM